MGHNSSEIDIKLDLLLSLAKPEVMYDFLETVLEIDKVMVNIKIIALSNDKYQARIGVLADQVIGREGIVEVPAIVFFGSKSAIKQWVGSNILPFLNSVKSEMVLF